MAKSIPFSLYSVKDLFSVEAKSLFQQRLANAMKRRGLTENSLADKLSGYGERVYASAVNNWVKKGSLPSGKMMILLPDALDVDGHWLLTGEGAMERLPPDSAAVALAVIEGVVDASKDEETFQRFWGYWQAFKMLSEDGAAEQD
jgi:transcriptional regulator with XRE-family HTH domain